MRFLLEFLRRLWVPNVVLFFAEHLAPQIVPQAIYRLYRLPRSRHLEFFSFLVLQETLDAAHYNARCLFPFVSKS